MLREQFLQLIMQESTYGFSRGIDLFIESLNEDLARDAAIEENAVEYDKYLDALFDNAR